MLCDRCQKKEAKILYTEIINGTKKEQHLCEECATNYTSFQMEKPILNSELTLGDLLSTILDNYYVAGAKEAGTTKQNITCSKCKTSYEDFIQNGRFGCADCYQSFGKQLSNTIKSIQGADVHTGKRPKGFIASVPTRVMKDFTESERLSLKLQEAIEKEEFEEAARLRDQIKELKKEETNNA
ncbi:MAG: hypothetical protein K0S47_3715 [Herbinix sp.]|jgi:protein arginine kinase activator|nr:hypothetical protein [Herbinix sp.]